MKKLFPVGAIGGQKIHLTHLTVKSININFMKW